MVLAIAQLSNIPPGKDINSRVLLNHVLADLSHARMWTSRDLTRWTSEKVACASTWKFVCSHQYQTNIVSFGTISPVWFAHLG